VGDFTKTVTFKYAPWHESIAGQIAIAKAREHIETVAQAEFYIDEFVKGGLSLVETTVEVSQSQPSGRAPSSVDRIKSKYADRDSGSSNTDYSTNSKSEMELITGNESAKRRTEFSMPYAPDDTFYRSGGISVGGESSIAYYSVKSDAEKKARNYGEVQNRMLNGARNGINIQTVPEKIPLRPFSPFYIVAMGTAALYRTNALSWTIDQNGIIVSVDALYWGVAGKTA
jgi:hypothetical protein